MAGKTVSTSPAVACKRQVLLIPLLLLCLLLSFIECVHAFNSVQQLNGSRINLVHIDSLLFPNITTSIERVKRAVQRSQERLQNLQFMSAVTHKLQADNQMNDIQTPVSAGDGEFLMEIAVGTPALSYSAILDTGSDLIWTQCMPCIDCYNQPTPVYDPSMSSTYSTIPCRSSLCQALPRFGCNRENCEYLYTYGDESFTQGILSYENFTLSSQPLPRIAFGCGQDNEGGDFSQGGGLVGFGRGPLSLISQLGQSVGSKFSYCLVSITDPPSKTSPLIIGQMASLSGSKVGSTPILQSTSNPTFYYLSLEGISVGDKLLATPASTFDLQPDGSGGLIIDSGTTLTYLPQTAYDDVKEALKSSIDLPQADGSSIGLDLCFKQQGSSNSSIPDMTFHFKGADYNLPKENYLWAVTSDTICLAMLPTEGEGSLSIFGNVQQQNYQILYDNENSVLSFAPTACDTL